MPGLGGQGTWDAAVNGHKVPAVQDQLHCGYSSRYCAVRSHVLERGSRVPCSYHDKAVFFKEVFSIVGNVESKKLFLSSIWFSYLKSPTYLPSSNPVYLASKQNFQPSTHLPLLPQVLLNVETKQSSLNCLSTCYRLVNEFLFQNTVIWPTTVIIAS